MNLAAIVLAAGEGRRLRPITDHLPKPLCPVANVSLLDRALERLARHGLAGPAQVAVNAWYRPDQIHAQVGGRALVRVEAGPRALGTSGAVGNLRDWVAGRPVLVGNSDAYLSGTGPDLAPLLAGWDGQTVRVLCVPAGDRDPEFGPDLRFAGFTLIPAPVAAALSPQRSHLVLTVWRPAERAGRLELVTYAGDYFDTGTAADLLAANLDAAGGASVVAPGAVTDGVVTASVVGAGAAVHGEIDRCLVFPGGVVGPRERLVDAIRYGRDITLHVGASVAGRGPVRGA